MKRAILATTILLLAMAFAFQTTVTVHAVHTPVITLEPEFGRGEYPEWKNFTVYNEGPDPIVKAVITYPETTPMFKPTEYEFPANWTATPEPGLRQVIFESTDYDAYYIGAEDEEDFKILFDDGPTEEGTYVFIVSTTDKEQVAYTRYPEQIIDTHPPIVEIIYPLEGEKIKGEVRIEATATDALSGVDPSSVVLFLNETGPELMGYDEEEDVYYWSNETLWEHKALYVARVKAEDYVGNEQTSDPVSFYWHAIRPELTISPNSGTVNAITTIEDDVYKGSIYTYGTKTLGTPVEVEGVNFTPNSLVNVTVDHPLWGEILVVKNEETDDKGDFMTSFQFPTAPHGIYEVSAIDLEDLEPIDPALFAVVPEIIYKPAVVTGPAVIEVIATGLSSFGNVEGFTCDDTDALLTVNEHVVDHWYTDDNGVLYSDVAPKPGFLMPVLEPGTYEIALWFEESSIPIANRLHVVNDFSGLMDAINELEIKLDDIKPRVKDIQDRVITIETTVGEINATLNELDPIIREIKDEVVTIETTVGSIELTLEDIEPVVESIDGNVVEISTTVGNIKGTVTSVEGDVATVETDVGVVKLKADEILDKLPEPAPDVTLSINLATVLSAIAAIASITAVAVVLRRLRVAA